MSFTEKYILFIITFKEKKTKQQNKPQHNTNGNSFSYKFRYLAVSDSLFSRGCDALKCSHCAIPRATLLSFNPMPMSPCSGTTSGLSYTLATVLSPLRAAQRVHFSPVIHLLFLNYSSTGSNHQHNAFTAFSPLPYSPPLSSDIPPTSS